MLTDNNGMRCVCMRVTVHICVAPIEVWPSHSVGAARVCFAPMLDGK